MQNKAAVGSSLVVVLGTGGTIAGTAASASDNVGYNAAQLGASQLVTAIPAPGSAPTEVEQVAQVDSKDMGFAIWRELVVAVDRHLARSEVCGIVITHGTDTLEETAYFLQRVLAPAKPVVLVAAMRPATSLQADGPQNLLDALLVARTRCTQAPPVSPRRFRFGRCRRAGAHRSRAGAPAPRMAGV